MEMKKAKIIKSDLGVGGGKQKGKDGLSVSKKQIETNNGFDSAEMIGFEYMEHKLTG
jgi:hypothetical protein